MTTEWAATSAAAAAAKALAGLPKPAMVVALDGGALATLAYATVYGPMEAGRLTPARNHADIDGDGIADILTGAGPGGGPHVKAFSFPALDLLFSFYSGEQSNTGGVFVS